jgi:ubiquitin-protein ligase
MPNPRELRLRYEFEHMKALRSPYSLVDFCCADLTVPDAQELLYAETSFDVIMKGLAGFLTPEEYEARYPTMPPERYLIGYKCGGLIRKAQEDPVISELHLMEVIFGWRYPAEPPKFIWLTDIWHPNFRMPSICIEGHPFAIGLTLEQIIPEVGRMVQYQNYNVKSPLNHEAANWASENVHCFPVDNRDILDTRPRIESRDAEPLIALSEQAEMRDKDQIIELL